MQKVFAARAKRHHANPAGGADRRTSLRKTARRRIFPDISWDWLESELNTIATRAQDPYYISEADKRVIRNELFPFWKGKSSSEACDAELKKAGLWDYGVGAAITDLTYHMTSGGDTSPGFDIILLKRAFSLFWQRQKSICRSWIPRRRIIPSEKRCLSGNHHLFQPAGRSCRIAGNFRKRPEPKGRIIQNR